MEVIIGAAKPSLVNRIEEELDRRPIEPLNGKGNFRDVGLRMLMSLLITESEVGGPCGRLYADSLVNALATRFFQLGRAIKPQEEKSTPSRLPSHVLRRVLERMNSEFSTDLGLEILAGALRHCKLRSRFTQLAELRVHIQENLVSRIFFDENRLMFHDDLLGDIVALLTPVPGLPGEECSYATNILREEVDARRSQVVGLNRDVGKVPGLFNPGLQIRLSFFDGSNLDLRTLRQCELSSCL
jgi:hypothetical protein